MSGRVWAAKKKTPDDSAETRGNSANRVAALSVLLCCDGELGEGCSSRYLGAVRDVYP